LSLKTNGGRARAGRLAGATAFPKKLAVHGSPSGN